MEDTQPEPEDGSQGEATAGVAVVIRDVLALSGLSQAELAHYLGASAVAVSRWVRGDGTPTPQIAKLLAEDKYKIEIPWTSFGFDQWLLDCEARLKF